MRKQAKSFLTKVMKDKKITHCYIRKNGMYYGPNSCGYTERREMAGVYTKEEAVRKAELSEELEVHPINVQCHNDSIIEEVKYLIKNYINPVL